MEILTQKQNKFVQEYLDTGNATEAASRAYKPKNRNTAHAIGAENLRKPTIKAFLEGKANDAASMVYKLSQGAKNEAVRLGACKDILDRAGYNGIIRSMNDTTINLNEERKRILDEIF